MEGQFSSLGGSWISATGRLSKASYQSDSSLSHSLPVLQQQLGNLTSVCPLLSQCACWPAMLGSPPHFLNLSESHQPLGPSLNHFNRTICFPLLIPTPLRRACVRTTKTVHYHFINPSEEHSEEWKYFCLSAGSLIYVCAPWQREWHKLMVTVKTQQCRCQLTAETSNQTYQF